MSAHERRARAGAFMALALAGYCVWVVWNGGGMGARLAAVICLLVATWFAGRSTR